ncbi:MAG: type II secretion system secretin GspD [Spongiibacteraceae bacterium]|nr:type II secretion system secretin GspD [Spongiibacteraceae bacterium]
MAQPNGSEGKVQVNMRDAEIRAVIQWMADETGKQIVIDPRVKGQITVLSDQLLSVEQAYQLLVAALDVYGYAVVEHQGIVRIIPAQAARSSPREVIQSFSKAPVNEQVVYLLQLTSVSATHLATLLQPLVTEPGIVTAFPDGNALLLADSGGNVRKMVELARELDRSGSLDVAVIKLKHAGATEMAALVLSLLDKDAAGGTAVAADERSNSLLIAGSPAERQRLQNLVSQLDRPVQAGGNTRVIYLHYLQAKELVPVLQGIAGSVATDSSAATTSRQQVSIEASESANALVLTGSPALLTQLADVVAQLDIRRAQVLVEAVIVEVGEELAQNLGVEWRSSLSLGDGLEGATNFGLTRAVPAGADPITGVIGKGLTLGFYRNGSLRALLNAFASDANTNVLSTPSLMTLDNQQAEIIVGSNIPIITGQSTGGSSSTNDPFTTFERQDIGVTLKLTPQINEGDSITLQVLQTVESVSPSTEITTDVVTNKRSISTKVLVKDDAILVLGGLISTENTDTVSKVPLLGDLPLAGALFRSTSTKQVRRNLMVFIHPVIVDNDVVADELTNKRYDAVRDEQLKYYRGKFEKLPADATVAPEFDVYRPGIDKGQRTPSL